MDMSTENQRKAFWEGCGSLTLLWLGGGSLLGLCIMIFTATNSGSNPTALDACYMAQEFVKRELSAPSTARFGNAYDECVAVAEGNDWLVGSHVDSQNAFGAMLRSEYTLEVRYNPDRDTWSLLWLDFVD